MKKTDKSERNIVLSASTATESGVHLAEGSFTLKKTDAVLTAIDFGTSGHGRGDPSPKYMLLSYMSHCDTHLFKYPISVGETWIEEGHGGVQTKSRLEGYESVEVAAGTFSDCLKHKTVFTDADVKDTKAELRNALLNGTRYLWFADGVGLVKLRYEHSNGVVTEAELLEYKIPVEAQEYLPSHIGNVWTYKWQNDYRDEAAIEEWRVTRNFSEPENLDTPMEFASAKYEVKIDADERRTAQVKCVLTPKAVGAISESRHRTTKTDQKPLLLSMSHFGTEGLYDGYGRYLRDLTATDANGKRIPVTEIGKTQWMVEVKDTSPVTLRYKVLLNHEEREWPWGRDESPYIQEDCIFCPGYALFIVAEVNDIELRVNVPDNWHVSTPWHRIGDNGHRFTITDQDDLMSAYLVLGEHSERFVEVGDAEIVLALGGSFKASIDEVQKTVESLLHTYSEVFDGTPEDRMLFVANPDEKNRGGGVSGSSISVLMSGALDETNRSFWVPLVAHEVCHIWIGKTIGSKWQEYWFSEGFTEYYSRIACIRLGLTSENEFLRDLERKLELYLSQQGDLSIREAGENKSANRHLVYEGGSLVAAALDLQVRNLTENRSSLDDVMRQMYREFGLTENKYTMTDVIRVVSQIAGEDFEPFFKKYVSGTERLPLTEYLSDAGMDANIELSEELPRFSYIVHEMLGISSIGGPTGQGMFIHQSKQYQDDDNLIGINGTPVKFFDDIRKIAKDWKPGDVVELTLDREGESVNLPITLAGDPSESPPLEPGPIDVNITKNADRTESQRAIWSGILGNGNPSQKVTEDFDNPMALASARYAVKMDADERRVAHVKCVLTPKQDSGETLLLSMSEFGTENIHDGYERYLRDLTVTNADGAELPLVLLGKTRWAVKTGDKSPVTLNYKVLLNHDEREWPPGRDEAPYLQEDCIFCPGYALFVVGEVSDIELCVDVPDNWNVSTPWHRVGNEGHHFAIADQDDLIYAYMVLGTHSEKVARLSNRANEAEIVLAIGGSFKAAADEIQRAVEALLHAYSRVFGGTPKGKILLVANPYGVKGETQGGVSGRSISTLMGGPLDETSKKFWVPLIAHEIFHIWLGAAIKFFDEQEYWFMEGFTDYYSRIISVRLGLLSEADFFKNLGRTCESYLDQVGKLSMRKAGEAKMANSGLVYRGGSLVAAALDIQIRKLTQNQKSLDTVMKRMYQEFGTTDEKYTIDDIIRIASDIADENFEPFFRKYVSGTERLPLAEYFGEVGLDIQIEEDLPDLGYVRKEMLGIQSVVQMPTGDLIIDKSPAYQDGDILAAINGTPVNSFRGMAKLAKGWKSGDVVELTLERADEEIILPVTLGGTSEKPPIEEGIASVAISKNANSTDFQRAILSEILGDNQ